MGCDSEQMRQTNEKAEWKTCVDRTYAHCRWDEEKEIEKSKECEWDVIRSR